MKKKIFAGLSALALVLSMPFIPSAVSADDASPENISINQTNFPDEKFRDYVKKFDQDSNGILSDTEIAEVTSINVSGEGVSNLNGIGYFTSLTVLNCYKNQLTSLDVENNTMLEKLYCFENQLTSLNVGKNTKLKLLNCHSNQLTSLDVRNNTLLEKLVCYKNQLTSLDVSQNTALKELGCYSNRLTSLDVRNNTLLQMLYCYSNRLTSLDVRNNTLLENLYCYSNQLGSLDVSQNTALTNLSCTQNPLTSLDLSQTSVSKLNADQTNKEYAYKTVIREEKFDLSTLSEFDISKASDWTNAVIDGSVITVLNFSEPVTYKYDTGKGIVSFMILARLAGDANLDGKVDVRDCAYIARMLAKGQGDKLPDNADFNDDGKTDVRDAAAIARYLANREK